MTREGAPPCHAWREGVQCDESGVSMTPHGHDPDSATSLIESQLIFDLGLNSERDTTNS